MRRKLGAQIETSPGNDGAIFSLADYLQMACLTRRSVRLTVLCNAQPTGGVVLVEGEIWHASDEWGEGVGAYHRMALNECQVHAAPLESPPPRRTIDKAWARVLMDAALEQDEAGRPAASSPGSRLNAANPSGAPSGGMAPPVASGVAAAGPRSTAEPLALDERPTPVAPPPADLAEGGGLALVAVPDFPQLRTSQEVVQPSLWRPEPADDPAATPLAGGRPRPWLRRWAVLATLCVLGVAVVLAKRSVVQVDAPGAASGRPAPSALGARAARGPARRRPGLGQLPAPKPRPASRQSLNRPEKTVLQEAAAGLRAYGPPVAPSTESTESAKPNEPADTATTAAIANSAKASPPAVRTNRRRTRHRRPRPRPAVAEREVPAVPPAEPQPQPAPELESEAQEGPAGALAPTPQPAGAPESARTLPPPTAPKPVAPTPTPTPDAKDPSPARQPPSRLRVLGLQVTGPPSSHDLRAQLGRARAPLSACFEKATQAAGRHQFGRVEAQVTLYSTGRVSAPSVRGASLPGLQACVGAVAMRFRVPRGAGSSRWTLEWAMDFRP